MTNEKIKAVSLKLFAENGYDATSLENIATEVGIRKSSIYSHFKTKEDIFLTVFEEVLQKDLQALSNLSKNFISYNTKDKLHSIFKYYAELNKTGSEKEELLFIKRAMLFPPSFLKDSLQEKFATYEAVLNEMLISIFEEGFENESINPISIKDLLAAFYCMIDGLFIEIHYYARQEYASRLESVWTVFWASIGKRGE